MIKTVNLDIGNPSRSKPTASDLAAALRLSSVEGADVIISASWSEVESYSGRLWGARSATHVFRVLEGSLAEAFPFRPVAESVALSAWQDGAWAASQAAYEPDGVLQGLTTGTLYRAACANLGSLGASQTPKAVVEAVLRLSAWRASHRGGLFLPLAEPVPAGYAAADGIRRSGASELLAPFMHYGGAP